MKDLSESLNVEAEALPHDRAYKCRRLWGAKLERMLDDAEGIIEGNHDERVKKTLQRRAQAWIGSREFRRVCDAVGLEPSAVEAAYRAGKFKGGISRMGRRNDKGSGKANNRVQGADTGRADNPTDP